jgi:hypothetical protein
METEIFLKEGLLSPNRVLLKNEENGSCGKTSDMETWFRSVFSFHFCKFCTQKKLQIMQ